MPDQSSPYDRPEPDRGLAQIHRLQQWVLVRHTAAWRPPTDVYELQGRLVVVVEIAGMHDKDFRIVLQGHRLLISGVRQRETLADCAYHQIEIMHGEFRTEVELPWSVAQDQVTAVYQDGFLRVELPRAPQRKVPITHIEADPAHPLPTSHTDTQSLSDTDKGTEK